MKKLSIFIFFILSITLLVYVFIPNPKFPNSPSDFYQSDEPADVETPLRRGYYTDLTREEVINHYEKEFNKGFFYTPKFNYPPEEAQIIIRDQTKSSFLEEIVHPFRESIYINGFEPKTDNYKMFVNDKYWRQKVIVRHVPSSIWIRLTVLSLTLAATFVLVREYIYVRK